MLIFPQLSTGSMAQYPIRMRRSERTVTNLSEDGTVIALWDEAASQIKWDLQFSGLTDLEVANVTSFYQLCEGSLHPFLFLDPSANLLTFSENLTQAAWQGNSLLSFITGIQDPFNTTRATRVTNNSLGALSLTQTLELPGSITCAFSVYARASQVSEPALSRSDSSSFDAIVLPIGPVWNRFSINTTFASSISNSCNFSFLLPAGETVDLFGFQVEPQPFPGKYLMSTTKNGVYPNSRFAANELTVIATAPGQSSLALSLLSPSAQ